MFLVSGFVTSFIHLWGLKAPYLRELNILGENETVTSFTFWDIVGANTGFNLSGLISFMGLLVIQ